jgi:hypothetical protein
MQYMHDKNEWYDDIQYIHATMNNSTTTTMMRFRPPSVVRSLLGRPLLLARERLFHEKSTFPALAFLARTRDSWRQTSDQSLSHYPVALLFATFVSVTAVTARCEEGSKKEWNCRISEKDVNAFVDSILADKKLNITAIPDAIERQIYATAVTMTANVVYGLLHELDGTLLWGHELKLQRKPNPDEWLTTSHVGIDNKVLEQVADRLLSNETVNQTLLPDIIERQLHINCLKLIFHLLDTIAASFCVTLCGHDLKVHFEPSSRAVKAISSYTSVEWNILLESARQELQDSGCLFTDFQARLLASLYGLVLGIVDDLLANTEIKVLSDQIGIDVVPLNQQKEKRMFDKVQKTATKTSSRNTGTMVTTFGLGVGVGATAVLAFIASSR